MNISSFIARRYLQAGRDNRFFSWISMLTISGVAIGVAAMIVVWSVINGFESELRKRFLVANAHVMAFRYPAGLSNYHQWIETIERDFPDDVKGISPFVHYETMARHTSLMHATLVRGTDPELRDTVQSLRSIVSPESALDILQQEIRDHERGQGVPTVPAVILGAGLLSLIDAKVGDQIELVEPNSGVAAVSGADDADGVSDGVGFGTMKHFRIVGTYDSGLKHYDNKLVFMSLTTAQEFFKMGSTVVGLEIGLRDPWQSQKIAEQMSKRYSISIREWQTFNRPLFEAMRTERVVILLITALVAGVAGFNILTTIFVAVSQRQRDISILKALGANNHQVLSTFLKQGLYVGLTGCAVGMVLAVGISAVLERYQFVDLPDLYLLARLPIAYDWWVYATVTGASCVVATLAGLFPAIIATRVDPVEGFRNASNGA